MKIVDQQTPMWVGERAKCGFCKSVVEFEVGDMVNVYSAIDKTQNKFVASVEFNCPVCRKDNRAPLLPE